MVQVMPFNAILLIVLSLPIVMRYRILPTETTPYWLFGILFAVLATFVFLSLSPRSIAGKVNSVKLKEILLWIAIAVVVGGTSATAIVDRSKVAPVYGVHDIILQVEAAMRYVIEGKNPYKETYFGTPLEDWHYAELGRDAVNPALYHFVMPPWYLLFPYSFYFMSIPTIGFFDARMPLVALFFGTLLLLSRWFKNRNIAHMAVIITALSPATIDFFIEGRSDAFAMFWLILSLVLSGKKSLIFSAVIFGLALASKQTIWIAVPFYFAYLWLQSGRNRRMTLQCVAGSLLSFFLVTLPFVLWDPQAFYTSVVLYLNGTTPFGYPVSGYGLGMLLSAAGVIGDIHDYYPFIVWQLVIGVPLIVFLLRWLIRKPSMSRVLLSYAASLFAVWYLSRYFNNSHAAYLSSIAAIGLFKHVDETQA